MIYFTCKVCRTQLSGDEAFAGKQMRCPNCRSVQSVPVPEAVGAESAARAAPAAPSAPPIRRPPPPGLGRPAPTGRRYGFNCPYCKSRLEAQESIAGTDGQCPTCGLDITIPILDRYGRLVDPKPMRHELQDPHPVHAYAASGGQAPKIIRLSDGGQQIQCPRCGTYSSITSNNCRSCGRPFTMEGTTAEAAGGSNGYAVASLVLGIIGLPTACTGIIPALAIIFGIIGYNQTSGGEGGGRGMAISGIICGILGAVLALVMWFN